MMDGMFVLPKFSVTVHGSKQRERSNKSAYLAGDIPDETLVHHYTEYFGEDYGLVHYANPSSRNDRALLVISDSNDNAIEPLLASHYRNTYFVDLRHFRKDTGVEFRLAEFTRKYRVRDVIYLGSPAKVFGEQEDQ
jgi:hypothetical protein